MTHHTPLTPAALLGLGLSGSSHDRLLDAVAALYPRWGSGLTADRVERHALDAEARAAGYRVAAQDVLAIARGRLQAVATGADGGCGARPVPAPPGLIERHTVLAYRPGGPRHSAPDLLRGLLEDRHARTYVRRISDLAADAEAAVTGGDLAALAGAVNRYREQMDAWTGHRFVRPEVHAALEAVRHALPGRVLGYKPPGAGGAACVAVLTTDAAGVVGQFAGRGWVAWPVRLTHGLSWAAVARGRLLRVSAGLRLDFVGAADLGRDPAVAADGLCLACAIEPRAERWLPLPAGPDLAGPPAPAPGPPAVVAGWAPALPPG